MVVVLSGGRYPPDPAYRGLLRPPPKIAPEGQFYPPDFRESLCRSSPIWWMVGGVGMVGNPQHKKTPGRLSGVYSFSLNYYLRKVNLVL